LQAWPRPAQLAAVVLLVLATVLLAIHGVGYWRGGSRPSELEQRIDLNQASRAELLQLPGVGNSLAERIEDYRDEHGGFRSVDDLAAVHGVGPARLERLRPWVCVRDELADEDEEPPARGDMPAAARRKASPSAKNAGTTKGAKLKAPVNINTATAEQLQLLDGIGPKLAQRIIDARERKPFKSVDDLRRVSGIGVKTLDRLRRYVTVGEEPVRLTAAD
jgi:competence protein ComEA